MRARTPALFLCLVLTFAGMLALRPGTAVAAAPCSGGAHPARYHHIVVVAFENKNPGDVLGAAARPFAPYINSLANRCARQLSFAGLAGLPSLPQYLEATSGTHGGINDNCEPAPGCRLGVRSIWNQVAWRAYAESMHVPCQRENSGGKSGYAARHNPPVYFTRIPRATCARNDLPLRGRPNLSATLTWITPNLCHDMHSSCATPTRHFPHGCIHVRGRAMQHCRVETGDQWLRRWLPANVLNTPTYRARDTVVFLWWDEGLGRTPDRIPLVAISPSIRPGTIASPGALRTHDDFLWTLQTLAGKPCLARSCGQTSMLRELGLR